MLLFVSPIDLSTNGLDGKGSGEVYVHNYHIYVRDVARFVDHLKTQNLDDHAVLRCCAQLKEAARGKDPNGRAWNCAMPGR